jgi:hypothetical protein
MQLKGRFGQQIAEALLFFYTITSKSIKNELYGTYRPVGDTSLHKMNTFFTCSKRGIVQLFLKMHYPSVIILVEEIIHVQVARVQRSTLELSDLVDMISVW